MRAWLTTSCRPVPTATPMTRCRRRTGPDRRTGQPRSTTARTTATPSRRPPATDGTTARRRSTASTRPHRCRTPPGTTSVVPSRSSRTSRSRRSCPALPRPHRNAATTHQPSTANRSARVTTARRARTGTTSRRSRRRRTRSRPLRRTRSRVVRSGRRRRRDNSNRRHRRSRTDRARSLQVLGRATLVRFPSKDSLGPANLRKATHRGSLCRANTPAKVRATTACRRADRDHHLLRARQLPPAQAPRRQAATVAAVATATVATG